MVIIHYVITVLAIVGFIGIVAYVHKPYNKQHPKDQFTNELLELLDYYKQWNQDITTYQGAQQLLYNLNDLSIHLFNSEINCNLNQKEFNRVSLDYIKTNIDDLIDQIKSLICKDDHGDHHQ